MNNDLPEGASRLRIPTSWRSLIWQILFLTILPLTVIGLVITFGSFTVHDHAMRTLVGDRDERAVRAAAGALDEQISHRLLAVRSLAQLAEGRQQAGGARPDGIQDLFVTSDYLLAEFDLGLALFTPNGGMQGSIGNQQFWQANQTQLAPIVQQLLADKASSTYISSIFFAPQNADRIVLVMAVSPSRAWAAAGVFSAAEMVHHTLGDTFAGGLQASVIVVDSQKNLLYKGGLFPADHDTTNHPGVAEALAGESGTAYMQMGKEEHVVAYSPIAQVGWALVFEEPWDTVSTPNLQASQMAPLLLAPVLVLAMAALWFGARQIIRPLQMLEARAAQLAGGDFKAIEEPVGGIEEIRHLQAELVRMAEKVQSAQQSLHGYIGAITAAQEEERRRLARELHDDTIQALIALKQRVQLAQLRMVGAAPESAALKEIAVLTEQTIENLRRLTRALRPIYLEDLGLVTALEMLAKETGAALNIPVDFEHQGIEKRLNSAVELALYRMAQEAFSNIARHAQARRAGLKITFADDQITMQVSDNGRGFDTPKSPAEFARAGHYGLLGLHERAELIGARLEINSLHGQGTQLVIEVSSQ